MRPITILFFLVSAAMVVFSVAAIRAMELQLAFDPIEDVTDPHVQELGAWAVAEYDKRAGVGLRFNRVVRGESQVMVGVRYRLVVDASEPHGQYVADVGEPDDGTDARVLFSFRPVS
ncbi:hypothetical protein PR202_gb18977 [Eleusine coracana subsp. coracana]|uniref:Cystatin domain-containing protein n=1 Tax=Eleusine coracana subsp. coracana TaxID=191504 RepID=A0AAV5F7J6_ELECO|nr:hypothetical protein QOZ80_3BG0289860 [Eleusine coracana subsp. coracana]GJN30652.1 hypothetical protein PR202_gb18977 [Eleusine coracana subsp. coracana]